MFDAPKQESSLNWSEYVTQLRSILADDPDIKPPRVIYAEPDFSMTRMKESDNASNVSE